MKSVLTLTLLLSALAISAQEATIAFTVNEKDLIPEGITYDPGEQAFYLSSIHKRKVVKISSNGRVSDFISSGQDSVLQVLGMTVFAGNLWFCNNTPERDTVFRQANVHVYNLKTGKFVARYSKHDGKKHLFNDLYITKNGDAYITDSEAGAVYRLKNGSIMLEEFISSGSLVYPNGITASLDEKKLFVSTGNERGIVAINIETKEITNLVSNRFFVLGYDGLYWYKNSFIGVQNVLFPEAIHQLQLDDDFKEITAMKFLSGNDKRFDIPTTGVVVQDSFYFIANSQLSQIAGNQGSIRNPQALKPTLIMKLKLN